ncbi:MAG: cell division protein FtsW, partial [Chloroflexi bacterium]
MSTVTRTQPDRHLLFVTVLLCGAGLVMVTSASVAFAYTKHESAFYYSLRQAVWMAIGFTALFALSRFDYHKLRPLSELGKLAFALFIAHWIDRRGDRINDFQRGFLPYVAMLGGVLVLLMLQKDLGTSVVMVGIFVSAYWAGGGRMRHVVLMLAGLLLAFIALTIIEPYRFARLTSWVNPLADPLGTGFQSTQSIYGLASGGFFGVGIGHSVEKYGWLPEAHTDFIFAIIGEETGLIGTTLVMLGFLFVTWRGYRTSMRAPDTFGVTLAASITTWIAFQALLNMATVTNTLPVTGVPLPFFSYGGTALASTLAAVGVLLSIARKGTT